MRRAFVVIAMASLLLAELTLPGRGKSMEPQAGTGNVNAGIAARLEYPRLRAGSYVSIFLPERAYLAERGHALTVEFLGTPGVMPRLQDGSTPGEKAVLQHVIYEDLWPGIGLSFVLNSKGNCEATYVLAQGADVSRIRLRYNVPATLQEDGTLRFQFSAGALTESSPEAWQEINGRRVAVQVSFTVADGEVGFRIGSHDPGAEVTIDPIFYAPSYPQKEG